MSRARSRRGLIKAAIAPALAVLCVAHFAGFALFGENGLLAWGDYRQQAEVKKSELARLDRERSRLEHRVQLLDPRKVDPDYADELVRRETGQVRSDELVIQIR